MEAAQVLKIFKIALGFPDRPHIYTHTHTHRLHLICTNVFGNGRNPLILPQLWIK